MPKFLITYHGAGAPAPEEAQQAMAAFMAWASSASEALAEPGARLGPAKTVGAGSVSDGPAGGPANGYSIVQAPPTWTVRWTWSGTTPSSAGAARCRSARRRCQADLSLHRWVYG